MEKAFYQEGFKLGILGGGQLGRMFIQEALNYNLDIYILDPDENAPCKHIASRFVCGSFRDYDTVLQFGSNMDVLTVEIEDVNIEALEALEKKGIRVYPQPSVLRTIQDKGLQKSFYREHAIPTADFYLIENKKELLASSHVFPFIQKLRKGGYDGRGVEVIRSQADIDNKAFDAPSVVESFVDFEKEISVIVARNAKGDCSSFPVVELDFNPEANLVEFLYCPANITSVVEEKAQNIAKSLAEKLQIIGLLAVEMFLTSSGEVLVNEVAPRPHNSGHQSIEGNYTSQFEQHLRAILNLPLGETAVVHPSVMVNLLGEKGFDGESYIQGLEACLNLPGVYIHLYGKKFTRPFRKMGHVTILNPDKEQAVNLANQVKNTIKIISK